VWKALGDLHTLGMLVPPEELGGPGEALGFVGHGKEAYQRALVLVTAKEDVAMVSRQRRLWVKESGLRVNMVIRGGKVLFCRDLPRSWMPPRSRVDGSG
jgi:hypothetical protein